MLDECWITIYCRQLSWNSLKLLPIAGCLDLSAPSFWCWGCQLVCWLWFQINNPQELSTLISALDEAINAYCSANSGRKQYCCTHAMRNLGYIYTIIIFSGIESEHSHSKLSRHSSRWFFADAVCSEMGENIHCCRQYLKRLLATVYEVNRSYIAAVDLCVYGCMYVCMYVCI